MKTPEKILTLSSLFLLISLSCVQVQNPLTNPEKASVNILIKSTIISDEQDSIGIATKVTRLIDSVTLSYDKSDSVIYLGNEYNDFDTIWLLHTWNKPGIDTISATCHIGSDVKFDTAIVKIVNNTPVSFSILVKDQISSEAKDSIGVILGRSDLIDSVVLEYYGKNIVIKPETTLDALDTVWIIHTWQNSDTSLINGTCYFNDTSITDSKRVVLTSTGTSPDLTADDVIVVLGEKCTLSVHTTGTAPFTYIWYKNDILLTGINTDKLIFTFTDTSDNGIYSCKVQNSFGMDSADISLSVVAITPALVSVPEAGYQNNDTLKFMTTINRSFLIDSLHISLTDSTGSTQITAFKSPFSDTLDAIETDFFLKNTGTDSLCLVVFIKNGTTWKYSKLITVNRRLTANELLIPVGDSFLGFEDKPLTISAKDILKNDSNKTADSGVIIDLSICKQPVNGRCSTVIEIITDPQTGKVSSFCKDLVYLPFNNYNGKDTFNYRLEIYDSLASVLTASVIIEVSPINDAPSFVSSGNLSVNSDDGAQTISGWAKKITSGPSDESGQTLSFHVTTDKDSLFIIKPVLDPTTGTLSFTPKPHITGNIVVTTSLTDNGGTENGGIDSSGDTAFTITLSKTNNPPRFILPSTPSTAINILENITEEVIFDFNDPDGTKPIVQSINLPEWVKFDNTGDSYKLVVSPDFSVANNSDPLYQTQIIIKLIDAEDNNLYVTHAINLTVNNKNRAPSISIDSLPSDTLIEIGRSYKAKLRIPQVDLDGDPVTFKFASKPDSLTYSNATKEVSWFIHRELNSPNTIKTVSFKIYDGKDSATYSWNISLLPHSWEYRYYDNELISTYTICNITARDSSVLYLTMYGRFDYSSDGGATWTKANYLPPFPPGSSYSYSYTSTSKFIGNDYYFVAQASGHMSESFKGYVLKTNGQLDTLFYKSDYVAICGDISPRSKQSYIGVCKYRSNDYGLFNVNSLVDSVDIFYPISQIIDLEVTSEGNGFAVSDSAIFRIREAASPSWERVNLWIKKPVQIETDKSFGTTLYLIDSTGGTYTLQKSVNGTSTSITFTQVPLSPSITPINICMLSATTGWLLDATGDLYFTNNGFSTVYKETVNYAGTNIPIQRLYLAADKKSVFAYGNGYIFRY